jgi:hypothetical protein
MKPQIENAKEAGVMSVGFSSLTFAHEEAAGGGRLISASGYEERDSTAADAGVVLPYLPDPSADDARAPEPVQHGRADE